jgi:hypothetical protein
VIDRFTKTIAVKSLLQIGNIKMDKPDVREKIDVCKLHLDPSDQSKE